MTLIRSVMTRDPVVVPSSASVRDVLDLLDAHGIRHLPVVDDDGRLVGMVTDHEVRPWRQAWQDVRAGQGAAMVEDALARPITGIMTQEVVTVAPDAPAGPVAASMADRRLGAVVVVDGDQVTGIVSVVDLLELLDVQDRPARTVADLMTDHVYAVKPDQPLDAVLDVMVDHDVRHVPVVDDAGALVGIVSHRDVLAQGAVRDVMDEQGRVTGRAHTLRDLRVGQVMTVPETTTRDTPLSDAARVLLDGGFGCLPVVDDHRLAGIVTATDFVRWVAERPAAG